MTDNVNNAFDMYGRIKEGVHVAGYSFERACSHLEWLLDEGRWKLGGRFDNVNKFLESIKLDQFRVVTEERQRIAKRIKELQPAATNVAIANTLGVSESAVRLDLGKKKQPSDKSEPDADQCTPEAHSSSIESDKSAPVDEKPAPIVPSEPTTAANAAPAEEEPAPAVPSQPADATNAAPPEPTQPPPKAADAANAAPPVSNLSGSEAARITDIKATQQAVSAKKKAENEEIASRPVIFPDGKYGTIVIDPPWQMEKIERDVAPNQAAFEYPTMDEDQLIAFGERVNGCAADDCHLFMWTTHKHLPLALRLLQSWDWKYVLTMVWHKNGGFQPFGLPQYNCEFCLYARKGAPKFKDTKAFNVCFQASRREHGRKPDEFYDLVRRVTGEGRIDIFSREPRDGFAQIGNESDKFGAAHA